MQKYKETRSMTAGVVDTEVEIEYIQGEDGIDIVAVWMGLEDVTEAFVKYHMSELLDHVRDTIHAEQLASAPSFD